jgi:hypothetical protein
MIGIDVNAELNTALWRPVAAPIPRNPAPLQQNLKRKASVLPPSTYHTPRASEITSPVSTASESAILTPPAPTLVVPRPHKRSKTYVENGIKQIPTPSNPGRYPFLIFIFKRTLVLD